MAQQCELCGESSCSCKKIRVYFCPKCKSKNVKYIFTLKNLFGLLPQQKCFDCGFQASQFPILVTSQSTINKNKKTKKSVKKKSKKTKKKTAKKKAKKKSSKKSKNKG